MNKLIFSIAFIFIASFISAQEVEIKDDKVLLDGNPILGYDKLKDSVRLMFWSGASFEEEALKIGTGKFKDASKRYTNVSQIHKEDIIRWIEKSKVIQWDYKNIVKRKGVLERLV